MGCTVLVTISQKSSLAGGGGSRRKVACHGGVFGNFARIVASISGVSGADPRIAACWTALSGKPRLAKLTISFFAVRLRALHHEALPMEELVRHLLATNIPQRNRPFPCDTSGIPVRQQVVIAFWMPDHLVTPA